MCSFEIEGQWTKCPAVPFLNDKDWFLQDPNPWRSFQEGFKCQKTEQWKMKLHNHHNKGKSVMLKNEQCFKECSIHSSSASLGWKNECRSWWRCLDAGGGYGYGYELSFLMTSSCIFILRQAAKKVFEKKVGGHLFVPFVDRWRLRRLLLFAKFRHVSICP